jgi:DNA ligase D-like protein (predicted ligase)
MLPGNLRPMLARFSQPFDSENHLFEIKWDGIRALAYLTGNTKLVSRNGHVLTQSYPELQNLHQDLPAKTIIDGEIVCFHQGKPSFHHLQHRNMLREEGAVSRAAQKSPVIYLVFDLLYLQGENLMSLPLKRRKELLNQITQPSDRLVISQWILTQGVLYFKEAKKLGLEGIMGKDLTSPYLPGQRTNYWLKIKVKRRLSLLIGGYVPGVESKMGSLILGAKNGPFWHYIGNVGSGLSSKDKEILLEKFQSEEKSPLIGVPKPMMIKANWVRPELVCLVEYLELTPQGILRHPSYQGLVNTQVDPHPWWEG